jgi:flagellar basal body-associated protein FliL
MSKKKLLILALLPLVLGVGYAMAAKPKNTVKPKIAGTIYVMPQAFLLNLTESHYAKLSVALELAPGQSAAASTASSSASGGEGAGTLPEEAAVREIVTNAVTGQNSETLTSGRGRDALKHQILTAILRTTDVKVQAVLFPEVTVQ